MKNFVLIVFCSFALSVFAQDGEGIHFAHDNWEAVLTKAKEENKIIFVDAYTTWCGPCKWMTANVFPLKEVGEYYNKNFINVKLDMEKGEGLDFAKKYKVRAYPSLLFINGEGEMVHKALGSRAGEEFIALGMTATNPDKQFGALQNRFEKGERKSDFLKNYAVAAQSVEDQKAGSIAMDYLNTQKDWNTDENLDFTFDFVDADPRIQAYIIENRAAYDKKFGEAPVDAKLKQIVGMKLRKMGELDLDVAGKEFEKVFSKEKADEFTSELTMQYYMYSREEDAPKKFEKATVDHMADYGEKIDDWSMLNSLAWRFYETVDNKKSLKKARKWAEKSVALESNYFNNDTAAALCFKLGDKQTAVKYANEAIRLAEEKGDDAEETKKLLEKINAM